MNLAKICFCVLCCYLCAISSVTAAGKKQGGGRMVCWTNNDGVKECGDKVPPEYAQQGHEERSKQGTVIKETEAVKTEEELAEEKKQAEEAKAAELAAKEAAKKDKVLLDTYTSVDDIATARDAKIKTLETSLELSQKRGEKLQGQLDRLIKQAADAERTGKAPPEHLREDIDSLQKQIKINNDAIASNHKEEEDVKAAYAKDIARFQELKSGK